MPGKTLKVGGDQVFELVQILLSIAQSGDVQAGSIRMQVREAEGKLDSAIAFIKTDRQLMGELCTQAPDIAPRRGGDDIAGCKVWRADAVAAARVSMALGGQ